MKIKKESIANIFLYLIAIFLILDINSVWIREHKLGDDFFTYISLFLILGYLLVFRMKISSKDMLVSLLLVLLCFVSGIINNVGLSYVIKVGVCFSVALIFVKNLQINRHSICDKMEDIIIILAVVSLFFYFFGSIMALIPGESYVDFYWGDDLHVKTYYNIYFESQGAVRVFSSQKIVRNCGMFCEAPMFGFLISVALAIELFVRKRKNKLIIALLSVTGITTTSSTCIVSIIGMAIFYLIGIALERKTNKWIRVALILSMPIILIIGIYACYYFYTARLKFGTLSFNARFDDISACFKTFISSPIFGVGIGNYEPIIGYLDMSQRISMGMSTAIFVILAQSGICLLIWPVIRLIRGKYSIQEYSFFAIIFLLLIFTNIPYKMINVILVYTVLLKKDRGFENGYKYRNET